MVTFPIVVVFHAIEFSVVVFSIVEFSITVFPIVSTGAPTLFSTVYKMVFVPFAGTDTLNSTVKASIFSYLSKFLIIFQFP